MSEFVNSFAIDVPTIEAEEYHLDPQPRKDGWKQLDTYESDISRRVSGEAYRYRDGGTWYLLLVGVDRPSSTYNLDGGAKATWEQTRELSLENQRHREILQRTLRDNLSWYLTEELDYWERGKSQDFFNRSPRETIKEYDAYHGYSTKIDYSDGFYLTVDPKVKFVSTYSVYDLLNDDSISESYFEREYLDRYCTLMSEDRPSVKLVSIAEDLTVSDKSMEIHGERQSVLEYLENHPDRYPENIVAGVDENEPIAKVEFPWSDSPVNSAPSLLHPSPDDMSGYMTSYATMDADERWEATSGFVQRVNYINIHGEECSVSNTPRQNGVGVFEYPRLQFGENESLGLGDAVPEKSEVISRESWDQAVESGLQNFGAAKMPRGAPEIGLLHPEGHQETALSLYEELREYVEEYTGLRMPTRAGSVNYEDEQKLRKWVDRFSDQIDGVIVLLDSSTAYSDIRAALDGLPAQGIMLENYDGSQGSRSDDVLLNTAFGLAAKLGVRPVLLTEGLTSDFYLGLSVAGDQVNTAAAVGISGVDGDLVYQTNNNLAAGRSTVTKDTIAKQLIQEGVSQANKSIADDIQSITIHRNGQFGDEEITGIREGIERLVSSGELPSEVEWEAVQIGSNTQYRLYGPEKYGHMCSTGTYGALDDRSGVVATYGYPQIHQGTPRPLHCSIEAGSMPKDIKATLSDILALSFLNWGAPTMKIKEPLTTELPEKMHDILASGTQIDYPPF